MSDSDILLTPRELAEQLKVSECWIRDHASGRRQPQLPAIRLGAKKSLLRFRQGDIRKFLEDNCRNWDR